MAHRVVGPRVDVALEAVAQILSREQRAIASGVDDVRIVGARCDVAGFAAAGVEPVRAVDAARLPARSAECAVVLLRAADAIGKVVRRDHVIELRRGEVLVAPRAAAVGRDARAAVVAFDHALVVIRRDPEVVRVPVRNAAHRAKGLAPIRGLLEIHVVDVDDARVLRVRVDLRVVPGALPQRAVGVRARPRRAGVVGAIHPAGIGFDDREYAIRIRRGHAEPDVAEDAVRHSGVVADITPGIAAVGGLEDAAPLSSRDQHPGRAPRLPERGIEYTRIRRIHDEVRGAGGIVAEENLVPAPAAVLAAKDAAIRSGRPDVALRGDVDEVGVRRVHAHLRDLAREREAERRPCLARVSGLPYAVAVRHVAAHRKLASADIHDVGIRGGNGDGTDRSAEVLVRDGRPGLSRIEALEDAPASGAHVELVGPRRDAGDGNGASAAEWAELPPLQGIERGGVEHRAAHLRAVERDARPRIICGPGSHLLRAERSEGYGEKAEGGGTAENANHERCSPGEASDVEVVSPARPAQGRARYELVRLAALGAVRARREMIAGTARDISVRGARTGLHLLRGRRRLTARGKSERDAQGEQNTDSHTAPPAVDWTSDYTAARTCRWSAIIAHLAKDVPACCAMQ